MRISIVTPAFNSATYITETIESVLSQEGDFEIEYILADGASSDQTVIIFNSYKEKLERGEYQVHCKKITMQAFSEKDRGMYDAINKGFALATGEVYAWINSDDYYLPKAFDAVARIFQDYPDVRWISGVSEVVEEDGSIQCPPIMIYNQSWLAGGIHGTVAPFVLQNAVFWRDSLSKKAGPIHAGYKLAGDYALWVTFAKITPLYVFDKVVSRFRKREGQLSGAMDKYRSEQAHIIPKQGLKRELIKIFFWTRARAPAMVRPVWDCLYGVLFVGSKMPYYIHIREDDVPEITKADTFYIRKKCAVQNTL
jgi:glycosyltransferase involved in cell wall biosynthesis